VLRQRRDQRHSHAHVAHRAGAEDQDFSNHDGDSPDHEIAAKIGSHAGKSSRLQCVLATLVTAAVPYPNNPGRICPGHTDTSRPNASRTSWAGLTPGEW